MAKKGKVQEKGAPQATEAAVVDNTSSNVERYDDVALQASFLCGKVS
jgi:hypothetical protein